MAVAANLKSRNSKDRLDTLRENCGIIRKQASTDGGVLWKVVRVNVVQIRRKNRSLRDPRETRSRVRLDTLRENCGIIRKQASTDGGVLWKVVCVNVVQVRRKDRTLRDPREARSRVRV
ncbi:hypothetical protein TNCV_2913751 [Trichonephila clavipes]|nr:hypothetical protein TNCV_2913751 [Trichonephila clavipes]